MSPFDELRKAVDQALTRYEVVTGRPPVPGAHEWDCCCHPCIFVRGVRGELAAFAKAEAKAEKKRAK